MALNSQELSLDICHIVNLATILDLTKQVNHYKSECAVLDRKLREATVLLEEAARNYTKWDSNIAQHVNIEEIELLKVFIHPQVTWAM